MTQILLFFLFLVDLGQSLKKAPHKPNRPSSSPGSIFVFAQGAGDTVGRT